MTKMQKSDWRGCTDSDAKNLARYSGKTALYVDVLPLDPEMAQTSPSGKIACIRFTVCG